MSLGFVVLAALIVAGDQIAKHAIASHLMPDESRILVPKVLYLTYVQNRHGAFGLFGSHPLLLAAAASAVLVAFYIWYRQEGVTLLTHAAFALILGGAVGNIVDRLRLGYVVDFIDFRVWPVFNVADSAISVGVCLLLIRMLVADRRPTSQG
ncbi:MAG: signal peptidase II [Candidatus Eremiobacteraeota bacterium]|nr:signal peptidase II [Candidatus Eremiobacteraeota bacterium]